jgi:peptidoglycan/xylan/chitin deacetylase (PgdA/CDA1 family)
MSFLRFFVVLALLLIARSTFAENSSTNSLRDTATDNGFHVLNYHDVYVAASGATQADSLSVSVDDLVRHFSWLRDSGYRVVSMSDVLAARSQGKPLPKRAVMLSFDDGYASFSTHVLPLLKLFDYPATLAIVGGWIESPETSQIEYESDRATPNQFMTWSQIRAAANSGLVEIASHTYDLHHGVVANPQGSEQPAVTTRIFDRAVLRYESEFEYRARLRADLQRSSDIMEKRIGKRPRVIVWPYGAYNATSSAVAAELGMTVGMSLDTGLNDASVNQRALRRVLIRKQSTLIDMVADLQPIATRSQRLLSIDSARVFDSNAQQFENKLSRTLDHIAAVKPRSVILSATDTPGFNSASTAEPEPVGWFDNSAVKVNSDVLNRVAWQIRTRTGASVFVQLPALADSAKALTFARELGQRVPLAGIVFDHSDNVALASTEAQFTAIRESHATAESVYRFTWPDACASIERDDANRIVDAWRAALAKHTWVMLRMNSCSARQWQKFAVLARGIPDATQRTLIEHVLPHGTDANAVHETTLRSMEYANANGFRHLAIAESANREAQTQTTSSNLEALRRVVSIETYPVKR